jgi:hydrogenase maturation protein HypF
VAFDGFGLGQDGSAWGGEFLVADEADFERAAHLRAVPLPGGDAAVRHPWRMALAHARDADVLERALPLLGRDAAETEVVLQQIEAGLGSPPTSSIGRLFDAVAALTGVCDLATYEGQPAIWLEQAAEHGATREYPFEVAMEPGGLVFDARPLIAAIVADLARGRPAGEVAGRFHRTIAAATLEVCRALRGMTGLERVCLSGGVFQSDLLTSDLVARLETVGFHVFLPRQAPVGDGGIALGQVLVAAARVASSREVGR